MRTLLRRRAVFLVVVLAAVLAVPVGSSAAPAPEAPAAHAAKKLKRCKAGANAKKCRCPKGQKLVKSHRKYRCKKKKAPPEQGQQQPGGDQGNGGNTDPGTGTGGQTTDPGTGGENTDPGTAPGAGSGAQTERDDAGYRAALGSSRFGPRNDDDRYGTGYYTYTYDLCSDGRFSHHSEYYNSSLGYSESYYNGSWTLEQGFKVINSPNGAKWAGILVISENDGSQSRIEIDLNDSAGQFVVGNSAHLTGGLFSRSVSPVC